jgi:signal transduction protein with GAF and PtsI domain
MSGLILPSLGEQASAQGEGDAQKTTFDRRGRSVEAVFYRHLYHVVTLIHETENIEQIMLDVSPKICQLLNADRLTLYVLNEDHSAIVAKVKTGLGSSKALKLPVSAQSIAGYVAMSQQVLNLADVYNKAALHRIHPALNFLQEVDKRSGYRTKQMLVAPIMEGATPFGVLQVINNKNDVPFSDLDVEGVSQLCKTLALNKLPLQRTLQGF